MISTSTSPTTDAALLKAIEAWEKKRGVGEETLRLFARRRTVGDRPVFEIVAIGFRRPFYGHELAYGILDEEYLSDVCKRSVEDVARVAASFFDELVKPFRV